MDNLPPAGNTVFEMAQFAQYTKVPVSQTKTEIERILERYKADQFGTATDAETQRAMIQFRFAQKIIRFEVTLANLNEQQVRQRWRALALAIKSKLEAVESNIETFEEAFLAHVVMPDGRTFGKFAIPVIEQAILENKMPRTLMITDQREGV